MLYHMEYDITVGAYKVHTLKSVTVKRSVEQLSDTAQIAMPGTLLNAAIEVEDKIKTAVRTLDGNYFAVVKVERSYT